MSKRRDVEGRIAALNEIHGIMQSMKNLALMEARKLARYHETQQRVVDAISLALNDVRRHYGQDVLESTATPVYLLFGSERGFCGAYNKQLLELLAQQSTHQHVPLIAVGARLAEAMQQDYPQAVFINGAAVADEVDAVLLRIFDALNQLRNTHGALQLEIIHFQPDKHDAQCLPVLPPLTTAANNNLPPIINLAPQQLISALLEHYLFAVSHAWLFASLMAENQRRAQHLEQAGHHLELQTDELAKKRNVLRQEEIIEEIEVILLSSEMVSHPGG